MAGFGFVTVCYVMMGIYFNEENDKLSSLISSVTNTDTTNILQYTFISTTIFASSVAIFFATASKFGAVQTIMICFPNVINVMVVSCRGAQSGIRFRG